jgi:hypothetical protein
MVSPDATVGAYGDDSRREAEGARGTRGPPRPHSPLGCRTLSWIDAKAHEAFRDLRPVAAGRRHAEIDGSAGGGVTAISFTIVALTGAAGTFAWWLYSDFSR